MAINTENNTVNNATMAAAAQMNSNAGQQNVLQSKLSFMKLGAFGGLSRTPSSEVLTKAMNAIGEELKKLVEKPWEVAILPIDNAKETNLAFSGIAVVAKNTEQPGVGVAVHTFLLEDSGEPIQPRIDNFRGAQFEIQRVCGDAYDELFHNTVMEIVAKAYPSARISPMDAQVVPRGFNFEDKEAVHQLTLNGLLPTYFAIETQKTGFKDMDLTMFEKDASLAVRIAFNETQKLDYVGLPVRNDIKIDLTAQAINRNQNQGQINTQERSKLISSVGGYIDTIWAPVEQNQYMYAPNMPQAKFAARCVITNMENVAQTTLSSQLLALCSALVLRENNNYYPYFSPRAVGAGGRNVDIRDVGALNIEGNITNNPNGFDVPGDTKAATFTPQDLGRFLTSLIRPGMFFSLRVSEVGSDSWYNGAFLAAANGNPNAIRAILDAANTLTGGIFAQVYGSAESPVVQNVDRVHMGYYVGQDGVKRDVSDIDYLAIMNLAGRSDPTVGAAWSDTFFKTDLPLHQRLSARRKMIESVMHSEVTFTGFGRLVTFTNKFLDALAKSAAQAGLDIKTINPNVTGDFFAQRSQASWLSQAQVMPGQTGVFNQGYMGNGFQDPRGFLGRTF